MLLPVILTAIALVVGGAVITVVSLPQLGQHTSGDVSLRVRSSGQGRHTAEHLSTQPLMVVPARVLDIGEWR